MFGFPSLTLAAAVQALVAIKLFPSYYSERTHLATLVVMILANYGFGAVFWLFLYPRFFSPLRRIPGPKARLPPTKYLLPNH